MAVAAAALFDVAPPPSPPASPGPAEPRTHGELKIDRLSWAREVDGDAPIRTLEVRNDFGDVRARLAPDRRLEALAVVQRLDPGKDGVGFTVERRGSVVALVVAYPPGRIRDADPEPAKDSYDRLDLAVFVPEGISLVAHTLRGQVEVRGLRSDVRAVTRDGPVFVSTTGGLQARSDSGEITARMEKSEGPGPLLLETVTGAIRVTLGPQPGLDLRVETAGMLTSDFPVQRQQVGGRLRAWSAIGRPTRTLLVASGSGTVEIRRGDR